MSKRIALLSAVAFSALALTASVIAPASAEDKKMPKSELSGEKTVMVGGAAMFPSKNIIQNAVNSKDHTTLVAAVKAAGLVETVEGEELTVKHSGDKMMIVDAKGGSSTVTIANVNQSNGVIHVVDTVLMPAS